MNHHKHGTIMAGAPGSAAREISQLVDDILGHSRDCDQITANFKDGHLTLDEFLELAEDTSKKLLAAVRAFHDKAGLE